MEHALTLDSDGLAIEALMERQSERWGVVISHPHPLYGGDMTNGVVAAIMNAYRRCGATTLRFNFRGVGRSQGRYGKGVAEQTDVRAAIDHLAVCGIGRIDLAGYSFGSWVNARAAAAGAPVGAMVMVSPPVAALDFTPIDSLDCLGLVLTGSADEYAPPAAVARSAAHWNSSADLRIIEGADHFYGARLDTLEAVLFQYLTSRPDDQGVP